MLAVLEDAIRCFQKSYPSRNRQGRRVFHEAEDWLFFSDPYWVFSFERIADTLGIEPAYVRRLLRRWQSRQQASVAVDAGRVMNGIHALRDRPKGGTTYP